MSDIHDNQAASRFETVIEGHLAEITYRLDGQTITFVHTLVPDALAGRGLGGKLAKAALESAQERGLTVVPQCPFVAGYLQKHPEYQSLLAGS